MNAYRPTNLNLHLLTGGLTNFEHTPWRSSLPYVTADAGKEARAVRSRLRVSGGDYFVRPLLAAAARLNDLLPVSIAESGEFGLPRLPSRFTQPPMGAENQSEWSSIQNHGQFFVAEGKLTVSWHSAASCLVAGESYSEVLPCVFDGSRLSVPSLADKFGLRASFVVDSWIETDSFEVHVPLGSYPFSVVVNVLQDDADFMRLLEMTDLTEEWAVAVDSFYRVGIAAAAIIRQAYTSTLLQHPSILDYERLANPTSLGIAVDSILLALDGAILTLDEFLDDD